MSSDPVKDGLNWYQYCLSNPVTFVDPTGLAAQSYNTKLTGSVSSTQDKLIPAVEMPEVPAPQQGLKWYQKLGNWWENNGSTLLSGLTYATVGALAVVVAFAAAPVAIPALAAAFTSAIGFTAASAVATGLVAGAATAGAVAGTTGLLDIGEAFTGHNIGKDLLGSETYGQVQMISGVASSMGTSTLLPFAAENRPQNPKPDTQAAGNSSSSTASKAQSQATAASANSAAGTRYTPANSGPLSEEIAKTFTGGSYTEVVLSEDTVFYRVYGGSAGQVGRYMTRTPQNGAMQSQIDLALNPGWGNTAQNVTKVVVPQGTTIYEGTAAPQSINGGAGQLLGGGNQVYIPEVDAAWFGN